MARSARHAQIEFVRILGHEFRKIGWTVISQVPVGDHRADLLADVGGRH